MPFDIPDRIHRRLLEVCKSSGLSNVYIFGSRARGDSTASSDIDLAVEQELPPHVKSALDDAAGFLKIDIVELPFVDNEYLLESISKVSVLLLRLPF